MEIKSFSILQEFIDSILDDVKKGKDINIYYMSSDGILFMQTKTGDYLCNEFVDLDWLAGYLALVIDDSYDYIVMMEYEYDEQYKDVFKHIFATKRC